MDGSIALRPAEHKLLLKVYRKGTDPEFRLRAHILLLLAAGHTWLNISVMLLCSTATISRWKRRFQQGGLEAVLQQRRGHPAVLWWAWAQIIVEMVTRMTPLAFGYIRSRWCCATVALVLLDVHQVKVSAETVRRWLHQKQMVWRRPRPVLGRKDPNRSRKLRKIRQLLADLPPGEIAFFQDEVDISTNPKIGCMWMPRGQQAKVLTPGDSDKRYLAGSMDWRSGKLVVTEGKRRNAELFLAHLDELRWRYRGYHKIHVICDNAHFHRPDRCKKVAEYLARWSDRIELHYLPKYAPETNPIERVWWHLHEQVTRNHRCMEITQLVQLAMRWLEDRTPFRIEGHVYELLNAA